MRTVSMVAFAFVMFARLAFASDLKLEAEQVQSQILKITAKGEIVKVNITLQRTDESFEKNLGVVEAAEIKKDERFIPGKIFNAVAGNDFYTIYVTVRTAPPDSHDLIESGNYTLKMYFQLKNGKTLVRSIDAYKSTGVLLHGYFYGSR